MSNLQEKVNNLIGKEDLVRGEMILSRLEYVKRVEGKEGFSALEEKMKELDLDINTDDMEDWKSVGLAISVLLVSREIFGWKDKKLIEAGEFSAKTMTTTKLFMRKITDLQFLIDNISNHWKDLYRVGDLKTNQKAKSLEVTIGNFNYEKEECLFIKGYLKALIGLFSEKELEIKEEECIYDGGNSHKFLINWK